jgi:hypothetical protein
LSKLKEIELFDGPLDGYVHCGVAISGDLSFPIATYLPRMMRCVVPQQQRCLNKLDVNEASWVYSWDKTRHLYTYQGVRKSDERHE